MQISSLNCIKELPGREMTANCTWRTLKIELNTYDAGSRDVDQTFKVRMGTLAGFMNDDWRSVNVDSKDDIRVFISRMFHVSVDLCARADQIPRDKRIFMINGKQEDIKGVLDDIVDKLEMLIRRGYNIDLKKSLTRRWCGGMVDHRTLTYSRRSPE
jgi:hypothetical protein